ncbi:MAG: A/G-specific adenine glycosylase [Saprospiraceae bacterium]|nr:A/G-specific adenine glycosylase [Saprospiraceae bacterium]
MEPDKLSKRFCAQFRTKLLNWSKDNPRPMPWKETKDPYHIWLSEIILQQTRVQQGWEYFLKFKRTFPSIFDLANASEQEVLAKWQGLGYYSRARNLHATARFVAEKFGGIFPDSMDDLLSLKGVGDYTAAAISSFAFDKPEAVVDGNVFRVFSRLFGVIHPRGSSQGKNIIKRYSEQLLDQNNPAEYNQALLNFGALHCKPSNPICGSCPFSKSCFALQEDRVDEFPLKPKKRSRRRRHFNYLVIESKKSFLMKKRESGDIWQGLFDFPLFESERPKQKKSIIGHFVKQGILDGAEEIIPGPRFSQTLTHQTIEARFFLLNSENDRRQIGQELQWIGQADHQSVGFPKVIDLFFAETLNP